MVQRCPPARMHCTSSSLLPGIALAAGVSQGSSRFARCEQAFLRASVPSSVAALKDNLIVRLKPDFLFQRYSVKENFAISGNYFLLTVRDR